MGYGVVWGFGSGVGEDCGHDCPCHIDGDGWKGGFRSYCAKCNSQRLCNLSKLVAKAVGEFIAYVLIYFNFSIIDNVFTV